ncbi:hypothetical protein DdX_14886 [Ditylenchus destructor]|uniref:Uncharacterized protein n=1 Tax=Ditylenchus destructor TaxID=166010 RepID=A0AAD4MRY5_9BILA|nr:hypothetical protein DdX_14886 [Ditylenchus destructor]
MLKFAVGPWIETFYPNNTSNSHTTHSSTGDNTPDQNVPSTEANQSLVTALPSRRTARRNLANSTSRTPLAKFGWPFPANSVVFREKPKTPIQKTPSNASSASSGASKTVPERALNSAPNTARPNPPSNELQRRFSLTLGSQTPLIATGNRNHSGNKYDESYPFDDVDAMFSASDSEATSVIGPGGMNRIRLRRKVEMGAEAALPPMIPVPSQHKPLLYQDLPSCEPAQLNRPSPTTSIPLPSNSAARPIRIPQSQNGQSPNVQTGATSGASNNVQPTDNGKISSGNSSANKPGGLRIRQRIVTNPRVTHSQMISPSTMAGTMQVQQMCMPPQYQQNFSPSASVRCSSSASSSTGSTATSYKTVGTDPEFESSSISSGRLCHQFPLNPINNNNCLQYLQKPNSARRHEHSPSPYDLPNGNGTLNGNGIGENSNGTQNLPAFIFLPPTNQLGPPMPMSASSGSGGKLATNGKGQSLGMEVGRFLLLS